MRKKFSKKDKARRKYQKHLEDLRKQEVIKSRIQFQIKNGNVPKKMRLNRVVKELNISMSRLVSLLRENNFDVESNPNALIEEDALRFLFSENDEENNINMILSDPTYEIIEWIRKDFNNLDKINPDIFENLVITLLKNKGFGVEKSGSTNRPDGGIDVIAYKKDIVNIIIAIQIKYKVNTSKKVTVGEVRDFVGAMRLVDYFNAGMLITNSFFTSDSKWLEENSHNLELKDSNDIQNWLQEKFVTSKGINKEIKLTKHNNVNLHF